MSDPGTKAPRNEERPKEPVHKEEHPKEPARTEEHHVHKEVEPPPTPAAEGIADSEAGEEQTEDIILDGRPKGRGWRDIFWNPVDRTVFFRTGNSWMKVGIFYVILFSLFAAIMYCGLAIFHYGIKDNDLPLLTFYDYPLLGTTAVGISPPARTTVVKASRVIRYRLRTSVDKDNVTTVKGEDKEYIRKNFIDPIIENLNRGLYHDKLKENYIKCIQKENKPCLAHDEDLDWGDCTLERKDPNKKGHIFTADDVSKDTKAFGYFKAKPCVMLQINKMYGWEPRSDYLTDEENDDGDQNKKAKELKNELIKQFSGIGTIDDKYMPVICRNEKKKDPQLAFDYWPKVGGQFKGIPKFFFPIDAIQKASPHVFVQITKSNITKTDSDENLSKSVVYVNCYVLNGALNVDDKLNRDTRGNGMVKFGILITD